MLAKSNVQYLFICKNGNSFIKIIFGKSERPLDLCNIWKAHAQEGGNVFILTFHLGTRAASTTEGQGSTNQWHRFYLKKMHLVSGGWLHVTREPVLCKTHSVLRLWRG